MGECGSISSRNNKKHPSASAGDRSQPLLVRLWGVDMAVWADGGPASEGASLADVEVPRPKGGCEAWGAGAEGGRWSPPCCDLRRTTRSLSFSSS